MQTFTEVPVDTTGWSCVSKFLVFNTWQFVEILDIDATSGVKDVYVQIGCPAFHYKPAIKHRSGHVYLPPDRESIITHCGFCRRPIFRVSGFITRQWKMEIAY